MVCLNVIQFDELPLVSVFYGLFPSGNVEFSTHDIFLFYFEQSFQFGSRALFSHLKCCCFFICPHEWSHFSVRAILINIVCLSKTELEELGTSNPILRCSVVPISNPLSVTQWNKLQPEQEAGEGGSLINTGADPRSEPNFPSKYASVISRAHVVLCSYKTAAQQQVIDKYGRRAFQQALWAASKFHPPVEMLTVRKYTLVDI